MVGAWKARDLRHSHTCTVRLFWSLPIETWEANSAPAVAMRRAPAGARPSPGARGGSGSYGYRMVAALDGSVFGLATEGSASDQHLVLCGWYGGILETFQDM